jgi:hypothetical protein
VEAADWAILATLAYSDLFDFAPTAEELANACLGLTLDAAEVRRRLLRPPIATRVLEHQGHLVFAGEHGAEHCRKSFVVQIRRHNVTANYLNELADGGFAFEGGEVGHAITTLIVTKRAFVKADKFLRPLC